MRRILFKRPPNSLDRVEPLKHTRGDDDDHSALLSAHHHHALEKVSENLTDGKSVFSAGTPKNETLTPLQKDVENLSVTDSHFFAGRRNNTTNLQQSPIQRQPSL